MSIELMMMVWKNKDTHRGERLVLLALADNANDEGVCWPSKATIASKANLSATAVEKILDELIEKGIITKTARRFVTEEGKVWNRSNIYQINKEKLQPAQKKQDTQLKSKEGLPTTVGEGLPTVVGEGFPTTVGAEPSLEPSILTNKVSPKNGERESQFLEKEVNVKPVNELTLDFLPRSLRPLGDAFVGTAGVALMPVGLSEQNFWVKTLNRWKLLGFTPDLIRSAIVDMQNVRPKPLTISGPQSITNVARSILARNENIVTPQVYRAGDLLE